MSTLNSSSSLAQIKASYADNASYAEDGDVIKARAFLTACRLLLTQPRASGTRESHMEIDLSVIRGEMDQARLWLDANDRGANGQFAPRATRSDFTNFRD